MDFKAYLGTMVEKDASDLYLSSGAPASAKIDGTLQPLEDKVLTTEQIRDTAYSVMDSEQIADFERKP
jgi:twitching motility protein PilU